MVKKKITTTKAKNKNIKDKKIKTKTSTPKIKKGIVWGLGAFLFLIFIFILLIAITETAFGFNWWSIPIMLLPLSFAIYFFYPKKVFAYVGTGIACLILLFFIVIWLSQIKTEKYISVTKINNYTKEYLSYENVRFTGVLTFPEKYTQDELNKMDKNSIGYDNYAQMLSLSQKLEPILINYKDLNSPEVFITDTNFGNELYDNKLFSDLHSSFGVKSNNLDLTYFNKKDVTIVGDVKQVIIDCRKNKLSYEDYSAELNSACNEMKSIDNYYKQNYSEYGYKSTFYPIYTLNYIVIKEIKLNE